NRATGRPSGFIRGEKQDGADEIPRIAHAAERNLRKRRAPSLGILITGTGQTGQRRARGDCIDPDTVRGQVERHCVRQRAATALSRDIGGALRPRDFRELRGDIDDAAAATLADHLPGCRLAEMKHPGQINGDDTLPLGGIEVEKVPAMTDPGAVEQYIEPAEL